MTIRVLIIEQMLPPYGIDGKRIHVYDLAQGLSRKGIDVHIVTEKLGIHKNTLGSEGLEEFPWDNFTVHSVVPVLKKFDWLFYIALVSKYVKKINKEYKFDIIHAHGPHSGFLAYHKPKIPLVVTVHGVFSLEYKMLKLDASTSISTIKKVRILSGASLYSTLEKIACLRSDAIIALTPREKELIIADYGVKSSKIAVIPSGVEIDKLKILASKGDMNLTIEKPIVLFVGRLTLRKGVVQLLQAWRLLKQDKINGTLVIVGSGYLEGFVREFARKTPNILLLQNVNRRNLLKLYDLADVFVLPSLFEGLPYTLLEALAFAKPSLISETIGLQKMLGDSVLYANPSSPYEFARKMEDLLSDEGLRWRISKKVKEVSENFSYMKMIEKTILLYNRLL